MSVSLSEAIRRGGNVATPKPMTSSKPRATSSLLKPGPKRRKIMLYPKTAEQCAATAAYFQQCPKRSVEFWRAKNRKRAEASAAAVAVSALSRGLQ